MLDAAREAGALVAGRSRAKGEDLGIKVPYDNGDAHGEWKIVFRSSEGLVEK
jgi:hypothetical protein